jgi:hypothetical protein
MFLATLLNQVLNLIQDLRFQDLTLRTERDAEPILNQVQHMVQHDTVCFQMLEINSQT